MAEDTSLAHLLFIFLYFFLRSLPPTPAPRWRVARPAVYNTLEGRADWRAFGCVVSKFNSIQFNSIQFNSIGASGMGQGRRHAHHCRGRGCERPVRHAECGVPDRVAWNARGTQAAGPAGGSNLEHGQRELGRQDAGVRELHIRGTACCDGTLIANACFKTRSTRTAGKKGEGGGGGWSTWG